MPERQQSRCSEEAKLWKLKRLVWDKNPQKLSLWTNAQPLSHTSLFLKWSYAKHFWKNPLKNAWWIPFWSKAIDYGYRLTQKRILPWLFTSTFSEFLITTTVQKVFVVGVFLIRIQSICGKIQIRKTPNTGAFHAANYSEWWLWTINVFVWLDGSCSVWTVEIFIKNDTCNKSSFWTTVTRAHVYIYVTSFAKIKSYIFLVTSKLGWHQSCRKFKKCYNLLALGSKKFKPK